MDTKHILILAETYAAHRGIGLFAVANHVGVHDRLFPAIKAGRSCRVDTFMQVLTWFEENWPSDLEWPPAVPRPKAKRPRAA